LVDKSKGEVVDTGVWRDTRYLTEDGAGMERSARCPSKVRGRGRRRRVEKEVKEREVAGLTYCGRKKREKRLSLQLVRELTVREE